MEAWNRSGLSAQEFATRRKLSARTLTWWKWHLSRAQTPTFVPIEVAAADADDSPVDWELRTAAGHVLRVSGQIADEDLSAILQAITSGDRP